MLPFISCVSMFLLIIMRLSMMEHEGEVHGFLLNTSVGEHAIESCKPQPSWLA